MSSVDTRQQGSTLDNSQFPPIEIFNPRVVDTCRVSTRVNGVNSHTDGGADIIGSAVSAPLRYGAESARAGAATTSWRRATPSLLCGGGGPCCGYTVAPMALWRPWRCGGCFCSLLAGYQPPPARGACCWRPSKQRPKLATAVHPPWLKYGGSICSLSLLAAERCLSAPSSSERLSPSLALCQPTLAALFCLLLSACR